MDVEGQSENLLVKLTIEGREVAGAVALPTGRQSRRVVLPVLRQLTDVVVGIAEGRERDAGNIVSCTKGCDACCRQMVPVSESEAFDLAAVVARMPTRTAAKIRKRFDAALKTLQQGGVLERLRDRTKLSPPELATLDRDYFATQLPCPFLEDHACSIHTERPLACREYLVTSPAKFCKNPEGNKVRRVELGARFSTALRAEEGDEWVPLILSLEIAAQRREKVGPSAKVLKGVLARL